MAAAVLPIITGLAGLFGGLKPQTQTQTTNSTTNQSGTQSQQGSTSPVFNELQQKLMGLFTQGSADFYRRGTDLNPYMSAGLQAYGSQGNANRQILDSILASRGLSFSPAAASAQTQNLLNTGNQQAQFLSQLPLLQRQLEQGGLNQLISAFGAIPTGSTSSSSGEYSGTSNTSGTSKSTIPGNPIAGALSGVGAALPLAFPSLFGGQQKPLGRVGDYAGADNFSTYNPFQNLPMPQFPNISAGTPPTFGGKPPLNINPYGVPKGF